MLANPLVSVLAEPASPELVRQLQDRIAQLEQVQAQLRQSQQNDQILAQLNEQMRWEANTALNQWADQLLQGLVPHIEGMQAALYLAQDNPNEFKLIGSYAASSDAVADIVAGVGLPGEAVRTGNPIYLTQDQDLHFYASTGLAKVQGQALLLQPLVYNDITEGLLELVLLRPLDQARRELILPLSRMLGAHLSTVRNQLRIQRLFGEAQSQREQLIAQEEEMRQNLEELEATQEEMRRSQTLARERQDLLNSLLNNSQDTIIAVDREFRVLLFNQQLENNFKPLGLTVTAGMSVWGLLPAEQHDYYRALYNRAFEGDSFSEAIHYQMDGLDIHFDTQYFPLRLANGQIIGAGSMARNVSESRRAAVRLEQQQQHLEQITQELQLEHARFERIARNLEGMIYQYELNTATGEHGFAYVSPRCKDMFGIEPDDLVVRRDSGATLGIHPEDAGHFAAVFGKSAQSLTPFHWVGRIDNGKGESRWIQADSVPSLTDNGMVLWDGYMVDITASRAAQSQMDVLAANLAAEHARFERIARNLEGMIYQYELNPATGEHGFAYVSTRSQDLFGIAPEDLVSRRENSATLGVHPEDLESFTLTFTQSAQTLSPFHWIGRIDNGKGEYRWIQADSVPSMTEQNIILWDGYMVDVTDRHERGKLDTTDFGAAQPKANGKVASTTAKRK